MVNFLLLLLLLLLLLEKIVVNQKRYTGINRCQNISFHWSNRYKLRYEIDSLGI